jgi:hypothetical protein
MTDKNKEHTLEMLRTLTAKVESGELEVDEYSYDFGMRDIDDHKTNMRIPQHTGRDTLTLHLVRPDTVKECREAVISNRMPGVPAHLYERIGE